MYGTYAKQVRWALNHHLIAYSLSNTCTKNCWNLTTTIKIIVGGWVVHLFETQYRTPIEITFRKLNGTTCGYL